MTPERANIDTDDLVRLYASGESVNALAEKFGFSRPTITRYLKGAGVTLRSASEQERIKWERMTPDARKRQVEAAHAASRGVPKTIESLEKSARTRQERVLHSSPGEVELQAMLAARGVETIRQQAIGPYNCDLGAEPVAVEIFGGNWHWHGKHLRRTPERLRYLLDRGWHVLMVLNAPGIGWGLTEKMGDYVAAYIEGARRNPTALREYRVVRGAGETLASGGADDYELSIEWAFTSRRDPVTGRYESAPR